MPPCVQMCSLEHPRHKTRQYSMVSRSLKFLAAYLKVNWEIKQLSFTERYLTQMRNKSNHCFPRCDIQSLHDGYQAKQIVIVLGGLA